jgi:SAM-dependent methyltransferase
MAQHVRSQICAGLPHAGLRRYTRWAFEMLPALDRPCILDAGCGAGGPTLELARLGGGPVVGLDIDLPALKTLQRTMEAAGLTAWVSAVLGSIDAIGFRDEAFDLVWAEGSIFVLGFEAGLRAWRRLLRPGGFLGVHEAVWLRPDPPSEVRAYWTGRFRRLGTVPEMLAQISPCGFRTVGHFALPEDAWWTAYYAPLGARIAELRVRYAADPEVLAVLDQEQQEVHRFRASQRWFGSAYFLMQKVDANPA